MYTTCADVVCRSWQIRCTCALSLVTLSEPPTSLTLQVTDHSFCCLWNQLPDLFCHPDPNISTSDLPRPAGRAGVLNAGMLNVLNAQNAEQA